MIALVIALRDSRLVRQVAEFCETHKPLWVVACTSQPAAAVQAIAQRTPDLVICEDLDGMTARELIAQTCEQKHIPFLVLGADPSSENLLALIHAGVADVLPRPTAPEDVTEALDRWLRRVQGPEQDDLLAGYQSLRQTLDKKFFEDTISASQDAAILANRQLIVEEYQLRFPESGQFYAVHIVLDHRPEEQLLGDVFLPVLKLKRLAETVFSSRCDTIVWYPHDRSLTLLIGHRGSLDLSGLCRELFRRCRRERQQLGILDTITLGLGLQSAALSDVPELVESSKFATWMRYTDGGDRIYSCSDIAGTFVPHKKRITPEMREQLDTWVKQLNIDRLCKTISHSLDQTRSGGEFVSLAKALVDVLLELFNAQSRGRDRKPSKVLRLNKDIPQVECYDDTFRIRSVILAWAEINMHTLIGESSEKECLDVLLAKQYVAEHFASPIHLKEVAEAVRLSENYFCMKFKAFTGETFLEYLTKYRIERSKYLLKNSELRVYEVAQAVGIPNTRYFSHTFRKHCGVLPSEYREKARLKSK